MVVLDKFRGWPVFTFKDVEKILGKDYAKLVLHNAVKRGVVFRLGKGVYSFYDDPVLAVFAFRPAYLGLEYALSFYEFWEQESIPIILTSRRVRFGVRNVLGENVLIRYMKPEGMFGIEHHEYYGFHIPVSSPEKTLADFVYYNEPITEQALDELLNHVDIKEVRQILVKLGLTKKARFKEITEILRVVG